MTVVIMMNLTLVQLHYTICLQNLSSLVTG